MRRFELLLLFAGVFAVAWPAVFGIRPRRGIASGLLFAALIAQLQIEGYRWQMIPLYLAAVGLMIGDIVFLDRTLKWSNRLSRGIFGLAGLLVITVPSFVFPVPVFPTPSGPEVIGTTALELTPAEREEPYGPRPGGPRHLMVQVWYPAVADSTVSTAPIHPHWDIVGPAFGETIGLPGWLLNHLRYTRTHTSFDLPVLPGTFPVVIYSHDWQRFGSVALHQIETLVSNGYMVIAPDHTHATAATVFDDGEVVTYDPAAFPDETTVSSDIFDTAATLLVETFADDLTSILDELALGEEGGFGALADNADLTRIGVYGHGVGGGAAVTVCLRDERCDAVLGLDPWVAPLPDRTLAISSTRPAMFLRSAEWQEQENDAILRGIAERGEEVTYWLAVDGAGHNDFTMIPLLTPIGNRLGLKGPIPAGRVMSIVDRYLLGFFDVFLLGTGPASIETDIFNEVSLEVIRPDAASDEGGEESAP